MNAPAGDRQPASVLGPGLLLGAGLGGFVDGIGAVLVLFGVATQRRRNP